MNLIRRHIQRATILVLAFQILNISVQARPVDEVLLLHSSADLNRIDHAVEYVMEVLLHKKDAVPEGKKQHDHPSHAQKTVSIKLFSAGLASLLPQPLMFVIDPSRIHDDALTFDPSFVIDPPPPKA